jgi:hypothetical protein
MFVKIDRGYVRGSSSSRGDGEATRVAAQIQHRPTFPSHMTHHRPGRYQHCQKEKQGKTNENKKNR